VSAAQSAESGARRFHWEARVAILLSIIAGLVDVTGFLTLGKVFAAHITGNVVMATAAMFSEVRPAQLIAIPAFVAAVAATWMLARASGRKGQKLAWLLLTIQFVLLAAAWVFCAVTQPSSDPHGFLGSIGALIAVSAMACQHALLRLALTSMPSTAVMTGNITTLVLSALETRARSEPLMENAERRLTSSILILLGFVAGCLTGTIAVHVLGDGAWAIPAALAAVTVAIR